VVRGSVGRTFTYVGTSTFNCWYASTKRARVTKTYKILGHFWVRDRRLADVSMVVITRKVRVHNHKVMRILPANFGRRVSDRYSSSLSRLFKKKGIKKERYQLDLYSLLC